MTDRRERQVSGGFASRLRDVVDTYGSANSIAKAIERSEGAVRKWLRGESEPNVTDLRTLCERTATSIDWLVTGRGQRSGDGVLATHVDATSPAEPARALSHSLLESILGAVDSQIVKDGLDLSPAKRSMLVVALYDLFQESATVDAEAVSRLVKLAR